MSIFSRHAFVWLIAAVSLCAVNNSAVAAIMYGDFSDIPPGVVMYTDVTESSVTDLVPPGRFGAPTITGNLLDFNPTNFGSYAANGDADLTDVQLNLDIEAAGSGSMVSGGFYGISFSEGGDFTLLGSGSSLTQIAAGLAVSVEILEVDGVALPSPIMVTASTSFSADLMTSPGIGLNWANSLTIDLVPALTSAGIITPSSSPVYGVTKASLVLDDTLASISEAGTSALVMKKDFKINPFSVVPNPEFHNVPEPSSVALIASLSLAALAYRKLA